MERNEEGRFEILVNGIWIRRIGDRIQLLAEVDGQWRLLCEEHYEGPFSHIVEPSGIEIAPIIEF